MRVGRGQTVQRAMRTDLAEAGYPQILVAGYDGVLGATENRTLSQPSAQLWLMVLRWSLLLRQGSVRSRVVVTVFFCGGRSGYRLICKGWRRARRLAFEFFLPQMVCAMSKFCDKVALVAPFWLTE